MNCEAAREHFAEYWSGALSAQSRASLQAHFDSCASCQLEAEHLGRVWETLGRFPEPKPSPELRARFTETLAAYQMGAASAQRRQQNGKPSWWQFGPALQFGLAAASLVIGLAAGHLFTATRQSSVEVTALRQELTAMRHMVALSLLQQENATDRLRGVTWSVRTGSEDTEILSALLYTLNHDSSVNVRLAAADALRSFPSSPLVRRSLSSAFERQDSPLVQIALIDLMGAIDTVELRQALRKAAADPALIPAVQTRARQALQQGSQGDIQ